MGYGDWLHCLLTNEYFVKSVLILMILNLCNIPSLLDSNQTVSGWISNHETRDKAELPNQDKIRFDPSEVWLDKHLVSANPVRYQL